MAAGWSYTPSQFDIKNKYDTQSFGQSFGSHKNDTVPYGWRHDLRGEFPSLRAAVESFEAATGQDFFEAGCNCCGAPFSISTVGEDEYEYISGDSVSRTVNRPW